MDKSFDVFLSHNSKDKPAVRELAEALRDRGLKVWLDVWELIPGRPWQEALEEIIESTQSTAVLVGKDGLGPWQDAEMRGCLSEFVNRKLPVIPVLLPGAPEVPKLPFFLNRFTWVDMREGLTEEGIDRLQWGVTGQRPDRSNLPSIVASKAAVAANKAQPASARVKKMWGLWGVPAWIGLLTFLVIAVFLLDHYFPRLGEQLANTEAKPAVEACVPGKEREDAGITYVRICPGTFTMGSSEEEAGINGNELPAHQVTLREFWIGKTEITNEQYRQFSFDHPGEANLPAADISWSDAAAACQYFGGRLPTEAEWEYAARAGSQTAWSFGNDEKMLPEYAWYSENSGFTAHPVGKKKPNAWGLHDVHGNVMEWVAGWFDVYSAEAQINPVGPSKGMLRVLRGGSFYSSPDRLRSAIRGTNSPKDRVKVFGFRCAHDPSFQTPSK